MDSSSSSSSHSPNGPGDRHDSPDPRVVRHTGVTAADVAATIASEHSPAVELPLLDARKDLPSVPGYEVIREVGRGGMGVVYEARQVRLNRPCALKMILAGDHASPEAAIRFLSEAEAAARLHHENIVQIYNMGDHRGRPYLELEFVDGGNLAESELPKTPLTAARLVEKLSRAIDVAHEHGIIHRDLKPANILLTAGGEPKVADFGLAKWLSIDTGLTQSESVLGSPSYMAPEQAGGHAKSVGPAADIYALGAILYELLTGRPPFKAATVLETLDQVKSVDPVPPSRLQPGLPRDLETICLKCLQKEPRLRYSSAAALAEDLRRFLAQEPILARRAGQFERLYRWSVRNPAIASLTAAVAVLLVALAAGATVYALEQKAIADHEKQLRHERNEFAQEKEAAQRETAARLYESLVDHAIAIRLDGEPGYRERAWDRLRQAIALQVPDTNTEKIRDEVVASLGDPIGLAPIDWPTEQIATYRTDKRDVLADRRASPDGTRHAEINHAMVIVIANPRAPGLISRMLGVADAKPEQLQQLKSPLGIVHDVVFTPDNSLLVAACEEGMVVWDVATGDTRAINRGDSIRDLAMHPAGHLVATKSSLQRIEVWSLTSGRPVYTTRSVQDVYGIDFSADGQYLLGMSGDKIRFARPILSTPEKMNLIGHRGGVPGVAFSPDGKLLASVSKDRTVKIWDAQTGTLLHTCEGHPTEVQSVCFSPDGRQVVSADWGGVIYFWDAKTGSILQQVDASRELSRIWRIRISQDGRLLIAIGQGTLVWELLQEDGTALETTRRFLPVEGMDVAMHPQGTSLVAAKHASKLLRYDLETDVVLEGSAGSTWPILCMEYGSGGDALYFIGPSGTIDWWTPADNAYQVSGSRPGCRFLSISKDDRWAATSLASQISIFDLKKNKEWLFLPPEPSPPWCVEWSPDGRRVAVGQSDGGLSIWDLEEVRERLTSFGIEIESTILKSAATERNLEPQVTTKD